MHSTPGALFNLLFSFPFFPNVPGWSPLQLSTNFLILKYLDWFYYLFFFYFSEPHEIFKYVFSTALSLLLFIDYCYFVYVGVIREYICTSAYMQRTKDSLVELVLLGWHSRKASLPIEPSNWPLNCWITTALYHHLRPDTLLLPILLFLFGIGLAPLELWCQMNFRTVSHSLWKENHWNGNEHCFGSVSCF